MNQNSVIYLVGFMGAGKSTYGRNLAVEKGWSFVDLDEYIESKEGKSIAEIFEIHGEEGFRKLESTYLREFPFIENTVMACGGGTPCFYDNMDFMNEMGHTVYLKHTVEVLFARLAPEKTHRPIIKNLNEKELFDFISIKLKEREKFYNRAKEII